MKTRLFLSLTLILAFGAIAAVNGKTAVTEPGKHITEATIVEEWSHPSGFKFWLPDNWKAKTEGDVLSAEGEGVAAFFFVPKNSRALDRALDEVDEELATWLKDIKLDKPVTTNVGGVAEIYITGTGKDRDDGEDMEFDVGIYEKKGKIMIFFGVTSADDFDKHHPTFQKIIDSIR